MKKVAIVTDSNSGITQQEAAEMKDVYVLPMPFMIDGEEYYEDINLSQEEFYQKLQTNADISTSQPSVGELCEFWEKILQDYDEIVHIPMSSSLSRSCETASVFAENYDDKVQVVDNQRISVTQRQAVMDALVLAREGKSAKEIKDFLIETKRVSSIYIMVSTLKYLKKGGRITSAAAAIGTLLRIKPVLQIQGGKLDSFAKVMNEKVGREKMIAAMKKDLDTRFKEYVDVGQMTLNIAHTNCPEKAEEFANQVRKEFPKVPIRFVNPLSLSVACHIGDGSLALACAFEYKEKKNAIKIKQKITITTEKNEKIKMKQKIKIN